MRTHWQLIGDVIPDDSCRQVTSRFYIEQVMTAPDAPDLVVDLGCGSGGSYPEFARRRPGLRWIGVDIADSPEVRARRAEVPSGTATLLVYDGVNLPFADGCLPLVYSHQVLEHVRYPWRLLPEVTRVLRPGGLLIGSTSQLEPYHSYSLWNFTLYGFRTLVEDAGLVLEELRPSIDGPALIRRSYRGRPPEENRYFNEESPLNLEIQEWGRESGRRPALVNNRMLAYCGQFAFRVRRPA